LLDVDGVLTVSWRALPGAPEALRRLRSLGYLVRLITNTTSLSRRSLAAALRDAGFDVAPGDVVTAPGATAALLRSAHPGAWGFRPSGWPWSATRWSPTCSPPGRWGWRGCWSEPGRFGPRISNGPRAGPTP